MTSINNLRNEDMVYVDYLFDLWQELDSAQGKGHNIE